MEVTGEAFVLHRRPYRNTSALVDLLTREAGKVAAVGRGARGNRKRFSLEPFNLLDIACRGHGSLLTMTRAEPIGSYWSLAGESLYCGLYANELLKYFLPEGDAQPEIFDRYGLLLDGLAAAESRVSREPVLREFELDLLNLLGYGIDFENDVAGDPVEAGRHYLLEPGNGWKPVTGPVVAASGSPDQRPVDGEQLIAVSQRNWSLDALSAAKTICRRLISHQLGGRRVYARELFR